MVDPLRVRIRDGCRGGREQFQWNSVKNEEFKDREQYLGQSTKMGMMGKFGRFYLHDWYARKRDTPETIDNELSTVKAYEDELMQEALGLKPKKLLLAKKQLDEEELKLYLCKDGEKPEGRQGRAQMGPQKKLVTNEFGEQVTEDDFVGKAYLEAGVKGLGFASHRTAKLEEYKAKTFGTTSTLEGGKEQGIIKVEDDDVVKLGFGQVKSESSVKQEIGVKQEPCVKGELKTEAEEEQDQGSSSSAKPEAKGEVKAEVKREAKVEQRGDERKRPKEEATDERDDRKRRKAEKEAKEEKKRKKAQKKLKKAAKKAKKAAKQEKKAAKRAKKELKKAKKSSSSSSSSSSDS